MSPASTERKVDTVVVSYECRDLLLECCGSVADQTSAGLVIVDNASTDGSADAVEATYPSARVIRAPTNEGFARGVNRGVGVGSAPFVLLLNPDARLRAGALERMSAELESDSTLGAVAPRIRDAEGALELTVDRTMTPWSDLATRLKEWGHAAGSGWMTPWLERRYARTREARSLSAACLMIRRAAFEQVGGMDERFFLYAEDVDLCHRLRGGGWHLRYLAEAEVDHVRGVSARADPAAVEIAWRRSQRAFYRKHHPTWAPLLRALVRLRYGWRARFGDGPARARSRRMLRELGRAEDGDR